MERKKVKKVSLLRQRKIFLSIGYLVTLSFVLLAFEWDCGFETENIVFNSDFIDSDAIPPTIIEKKIEPPKPKTQAKIEIIDNKSEIKDEKDIDLSVEINEGDVVNIDIPFKEDNNLDPDIIYIPGDLEFKATFPGGEKALLKFVRDNTIYPKELKDIGVKGKVWIQFVIDKKGKVTDVQILQSPDKNLSKAALKTIKILPDWNPAKQNGKSVSMYFTIPINFILH
jgi:protein TonB